MQMGPGNMAPVRIDLHTLVRYWLVSPFTCAVLAALLLAAFWYFQATRDVAERGNYWPATRTLAFLAGLVAVELAFQSSLAMLPYISFPVQVVQKLLLLLVAPPLLALGAPVTLAAETSSPRTTSRLLRAVRSAPLRALTHPVAVFLLLFGGLLGYYLSAAVASSMRHVWLLNLWNLGFLAVAVLFWWVVLGDEPTPRPQPSPAMRLTLGGAGALAVFGLASALLARSTPVAPIYTLADTHSGGTVLLVGTLLVVVVAAAGFLPRWYLGGELPDEDLEPASSGADGAPATLRTSSQQ